MHGDLPPTERLNPRSAGLDELATPQLVAVLAQEQEAAVRSVLDASGAIANAVDEISARLRAGGRLHYVGAGTSGRLGVLDASEMPPTFGTDPALVCAHIAGGRGAITAAIEGAEDDAGAGAREMQGHVRSGDALVALSASGGAAFVVAAVEEARKIGAFTVGVANVPDSPLGRAADVAVVLDTGAEALTGSTRLKAGTAQKIVLNTISTAVMVRLEKVYGNLMVDVAATNKKLRGRATRLVMHVADVSETRARGLLEAANWSVKAAVVMARSSVDAAGAAEILARNHGSLRRSLSE